MAEFPSKSILTISRDRQLQELRTQILRKAGYQVSAATSDEEAISLIEAPNSFSLALLCHSVPEASRVYLVQRIKELNSKLPVLMLYNGYDPTDAKVDGSLHNLESPGVWLKTIDFLTSGVTGSAD
jgi:DNA-binding response OmpR family regulator